MNNGTGFILGRSMNAMNYSHVKGAAGLADGAVHIACGGVGYEKGAGGARVLMEEGMPGGGGEEGGRGRRKRGAGECSGCGGE